MFSYYNPSKIVFETGILKNKKRLKDIIGEGDYCIFTYSDKVFQKYTNQIIEALGKPKLVIDNILPNPDYKNLREISKSFNASKSGRIRSMSWSAVGMNSTGINRGCILTIIRMRKSEIKTCHLLRNSLL